MRAPSRRGFLLESALLAGGLAALMAGCGGGSHDPGAITPEITALANTRQAAAEAGQLGKAWLDGLREKPSFAALSKALLGASPSPELSKDVKALKAHLVQQHQADLAEGRVEVINGWHFSATEARVFAVVALVSQKKS